MSITAPQGFTAAGVTAGLKESGNPDLAIVVNNGPHYNAAAVFTNNRVVGAPVTVSREHIQAGQARAVVLNSGGANVCTGEQGIADAQAMTMRVGAALGCAKEQVLVASTGLIGEFLPIEKILTGIDYAITDLDDTRPAATAAAHAIMTTDTVPKQAEVAGSTYTLGGMAKGAGMLAPGMATMLAVITTDALIDSDFASEALTKAVATTFNRVDSDGCMSTSDTVVLLASGASQTEPDANEFHTSLQQLCAQLSRALVADAEGATHDIAITVTGAHSEPAAEAVGRAVARSNLVKTAIFGNDPNWGRILSQVGTVPTEVAHFAVDEVDVTINGVMICHGGMAHRPRTEVDLAANREVDITINLNAGDAQATIWTNDLTHAYVHENSAYST